MKIIGAALQESMSVVCEVDAFPPPTSFQWTLNNSMGSIKVDSVSIHITESFTYKKRGIVTQLLLQPDDDNMFQANHS